MDTVQFYEKVQEDGRETGGYADTKIEFIKNQTGHGNRVLEIGCNDGFIGEQLLHQDNDVYGVDIVKRNLSYAEKRGIKTKLCNVEKQKMPFHDDYFDIVILGDVIEHVFDTDAVLDECYRVLKKHGKLLLTTPNVASLGRRMMLLFGISPFLEYSIRLSTNGLPSVGHVRYYTKNTLKNQLEYHKFHSILIYGGGLNLHFHSFPSVPNWLTSFAVSFNCVAIK
jgi:2-polyprenyl-3-methyl-5-hydroxy-6-metoxy-1,4-benzoquinol methylase